jgi:hypothetical protein
MRKNILTLAVLFAALNFSRSASAALIVNVGSTSVGVGHTATIPITVSNTASAATSDIEGMTLTVQIAAGVGTTPSIASIDLITGTVWAAASAADVYSAAGAEPQYVSLGILTDNTGEFINANGSLATLTINTTGAAGGNYAITLVGTMTPGDDSVFDNDLGATVPATFNAGQLTVLVPEPAMVCFPILAIAALARRRSVRH